ncbi:MAG TPA: nuclear transport factor 2 family protein [Planctomycetota bacterium]|nr:nuclear transport factor 2 family protein [Planctomycetota bacterium]
MRAFFAVSLLTVSLTSAVLAQEVDRAAIAKQFFDAFCSGDMKTLDQLYAPNVKWSDPILSFDDRSGTMGMWRWEAAQHPKFSYELGAVTGDTVKVTWHADYKLNGNPIHNDVTATLTIDDEGKVVKHVDDYSWEKWSSQAFPGLHASAVWPYIEDVVRLGVAATLHFESLKTNLTPEPTSKGVVRALGDAEK